MSKVIPQQPMSRNVAPIYARQRMIHMDILGNPVEMRGVPIVGGGQRITASNGETGVFFD